MEWDCPATPFVLGWMQAVSVAVAGGTAVQHGWPLFHRGSAVERAIASGSGSSIEGGKAAHGKSVRWL